DNMAMKGGILALVDHVTVPVSAVLAAINRVGDKEVGHNDPLIITQASSLRQLPIDSSSMDIVVYIMIVHELLDNLLVEEISRVLKPGGTVLIQMCQTVSNFLPDKPKLLQRKLLVLGFLEPQVLDLKLLVLLPGEDINSFTVKASKPSWKIGSSFTIKKTTKSLPMVQIDGDFDLIDEDSLLTEEDLKKPQLPLDDCEVGSTRKACKNCTCGRAEAEEKTPNLGPTIDQLDNPESACGSCGLGDAFRCGTCPYKGLPPFKLGEKVSLSTNFLVSDF
ncbi:hypothetical protein GIB67_035994, partial [Kingdonia uniflora]